LKSALCRFRRRLFSSPIPGLSTPRFDHLSHLSSFWGALQLAAIEAMTPSDRRHKHLVMALFYLGINQPLKACEEFAGAHQADRNDVFVLMRWAKTLWDLADATFRSTDPELAKGYAVECAERVKSILRHDKDNRVGLALQEDLYRLFGIEVKPV
jgi:hypothetical protein